MSDSFSSIFNDVFGGLKYPSDEPSVIVAGVMPLVIDNPLAFFTTKLAPVGLLVIVTSLSDLLTILAQPVIAKHRDKVRIRRFKINIAEQLTK